MRLAAPILTLGAVLAAAVGLLAAPGTADAGEVRFSGEGHAENPNWSQDGRFLAFEVNRFAGDVQMYFAELTGDIVKSSSRVRLPASGSGFGGGNQVVMNPAWHPDGIAVFEGSTPSGLRLYYAAPGGAAPQEMLSQGKIRGALSFPSISPDGNKLAFVSDATGNGDLRSWNRSTDQLDQLTATEGTEAFPQFAPAGDSVVFTRKDDNVESIYRLDLGSQEETRLARAPGDQTRPAHAAGDRVVYFSQGNDSRWDLAMIDASGAVSVLAENVRFPTRARPAVSPDGEWVAYALADPDQANRIFLKRVDGTKTVEIASDFVACGEPAIGLQGDRVLLAYTALPGGDADWRFLFVEDITDRL